MAGEKKKQKKTVESQTYQDLQGNEYTQQEVFDIAQSLHKDSLNVLVGDMNGHCNKSFRVPNDGWYPWTDSLMKQYTINKEIIEGLIERNGHEKITGLCRELGGEPWNVKNYLRVGGKVSEEFKKNLDKLEQRVENEPFLTRWCKLKKKSAVQIAVERLNIKSDGVSLEDLKIFLLDAKNRYYKHKKEKYDILNDYYGPGEK